MLILQLGFVFAYSYFPNARLRKTELYRDKLTFS